MKKIIFFDADGTLWYPKKTKFEEKPWWIYFDPETKKDDPLKHLALMPHVKETLKRLKEASIILVLISQMPSSKKLAIKHLTRVTKYFDIYHFFDEIRPSYSSMKRGHADPKDLAILDVLKRRKISKTNALLIGDSYIYDYLAAKSAGVDCILIHSFKHTKDDVNYRRIKKKVKDLSGLFRYIN